MLLFLNKKKAIHGIWIAFGEILFRNAFYLLIPSAFNPFTVAILAN